MENKIEHDGATISIRLVGLVICCKGIAEVTRQPNPITKYINHVYGHGSKLHFFVFLAKQRLVFFVQILLNDVCGCLEIHLVVLQHIQAGIRVSIFQKPKVGIPLW